MLVTLEVNGKKYSYTGPDALRNALLDDKEVFGGKGLVTIVHGYKVFSLDEERSAESSAGCFH